LVLSNKTSRANRCILFDWGNTLMRVFPEFDAPMFAWSKVEALPQAMETLETLSREWLLAVATNTGASDQQEIRAALDRVDLVQWLDKIYCYKMIGFKKPSRQFFGYILKDLGLDPSRVVMVGDDFENDVAGAVACGIKGIRLNIHTKETKQGFLYRTIHDLKDLPAALALI